MLKKINFSEDFIPQNLKGAFKLLQEEFEGNLWFVEEMDMTHEVFNAGVKSQAPSKTQKMLVCREIEPGIYEGVSPNFGVYLNILADHELEEKEDHINLKTGETFSSYYNPPKKIDWEHSVKKHGVADSVEQVKKYFAPILNSEHKNIIYLQKINQSTQPKENGWKWEKWGEYIGTQKSQAHYLKDEPEIESLYCFEIFSVNIKKDLQVR